MNPASYTSRGNWNSAPPKPRVRGPRPFVLSPADSANWPVPAPEPVPGDPGPAPSASDPVAGEPVPYYELVLD